MSKKPSPRIDLPTFSTGQTVTSDLLNALFKGVFAVAKFKGAQIVPPVEWEKGDTVTSEAFSKLTSDIELIYKHVNRTPPKWSFADFKSGSVITAAILNEIVDSVKALLESK